MPYRRQGNKVLHYENGGWKVKQVCSSMSAAKKAMKLLYGLESGSIKKRK